MAELICIDCGNSKTLPELVMIKGEKMDALKWFVSMGQRCTPCRTLRLQQFTEALRANRLGTVHAKHLDTEMSAAEDNRPKSGSQRCRVFFALGEQAAGLTDYELGEVLGILRTSAGKRRKELTEIGLVEMAHARRPTDTGSEAHVWVLTDQGRMLITDLA